MPLPRELLAVITLVTAPVGCASHVEPDASVDGSPCDAAAGELQRPAYPPSGSVFTSRNIQFRWTGTTPASLEVCRDRSCRQVVARTDHVSMQASVTDLPTGSLFWRVVTSSCGAPPPTVFEIMVTNSQAAAGAAWGDFLDVNGDGFSDLLVAEFDGRISLFAGGPTGLNQSPASFTADRADLRGISSAGDLNGDGLGDWAVARSDRVDVYHGSATTFGAAPAQSIAVSGAAVGNSPLVAGAGDVNGDGYGDLVIANHVPLPGFARVYHGSANGIDPSSPAEINPPMDVGNFGSWVSGLGDVNADGYSDLAVIAAYSATLGGANAVLIYTGGLSGVDQSRFLRLPAAAPPIEAGNAIAAGDVNGDGLPDILYDARSPDSVLFAGTGGTGTPQMFASLQHAMYPIVAAGDVNGDGLADLLVTRTGPTFFTPDIWQGSVSGVHLSWSGESTNDAIGLSAGDFNGDGLGDVAVGDPDRAVVRIYHGSSSGLPTTPTMILHGRSGMGFGQTLAP